MAMRGRPERRGWVGGKSTWAPRRSGEPSAAEIPASNGKLSARPSRMRSGTSMLNSPGSGEVSRLARLVDRPRAKRDKIMRLKRPFSLHRYRPGEGRALLGVADTLITQIRPMHHDLDHEIGSGETGNAASCWSGSEAVAVVNS